MTNTPNFNLSIAEGTDTVNLLTQCYPNFETIDTVMKENKDAAITTATETKTGTNHSIVRANADAEVFRFTATSDYVAGDTFTVDAQAVTVTTPDGQSLQSGAFVINKSVICCLVGTVLTVFVGGGSSDAQTLGGQLPSYYAKQSDMDVVENDVDTLNSNLTALEVRVEALESGSADDYILGDLVDLRTYASATNTFDVPSDGYIVVNTGTYTQVHILSGNNDVVTQFAGASSANGGLMYVKKGFKVYWTGPNVNYISYYPLNKVV